MDGALLRQLYESLSYSDVPWLADTAWGLAWACGLSLALAFVAQTRRDLRRSTGGFRSADRWVPTLLAAALVTLSWSSLAGQGVRSYLGHDSELLEAVILHAQGPLLALPALPGDPLATWGRMFFFFVLVVDRVGQVLDPLVPALLKPLLSDRGVYWPLALLITGSCTCWVTYFMARVWGARPAAATVGTLLALAAPVFVFHSNSLGDYLAGGLVLAAGLHLQLRRLSQGRLLCAFGMAEGLAVMGAVFYTRYTSLFLLIPLVAVRLLATGPPIRRLAHAAALSAGALLLVIPELPRLRVLAAGQATSHIFSQYGTEAVATLSLRNLATNLNTSSLTGHLHPLLEPALLSIAVIGLLAMWRSAGVSNSSVDPSIPDAGARRVGRIVAGLVLVTLLLNIGITYLNIHPGSRSLFPLLFWAAVPLAHGSAWLAYRAGPWRLARWACLTILLSLGSWQAVQSLHALQDNWSDTHSQSFERMREGIPRVSRSEATTLLARWSGGRPISIIYNGRVNPLDLATPLNEERSLMQCCYETPVVSWSSKFVDLPTLYITEPAEFTWSLQFRRDYFIQLSSSFSLHPAFLFEDWLVFTVTPHGTAPHPFPAWTP